MSMKTSFVCMIFFGMAIIAANAYPLVLSQPPERMLAQSGLKNSRYLSLGNPLAPRSTGRKGGRPKPPPTTWSNLNKLLPSAPKKALPQKETKKAVKASTRKAVGKKRGGKKPSKLLLAKKKRAAPKKKSLAHKKASKKAPSSGNKKRAASARKLLGKIKKKASPKRRAPKNEQS